MTCSPSGAGDSIESVLVIIYLWFSLQEIKPRTIIAIVVVVVIVVIIIDNINTYQHHISS